MKVKFLKYLFILCIVFSNVSFAVAQDDSLDIVFEDLIESEFFVDTVGQKIDEEVKEHRRKKQEYIDKDHTEKTEVELKEFSKEKWNEYHTERDYIEVIEEEEEQDSNDFNFPKIEGLGFLGTVIKLLVYLFLILGIAFAIFKLVEAQYRKDAIISNEKKFFIEKLEEQIHDVDLYKLLAEYSAENDYRMMVRINYLIVIKELSNKNLIAWEIQKTNGTYLQEMFSHELFKPFQKLTVLFERVWFGEVAVDQKIYEEIEPLFKNTIEEIKKIHIDNK